MMMVTPFRKRDKLNSLAPCVTKIAIITNKQYFVPAVQTGFIENATEQLK